MRVAISWAVLGIAAALAAAPDGAAAAVRVPVWVENRGAAVPVDVPLRVGVPLPRGVLSAGATLAARVGDDLLAAQTTPLEHWQDGSVRWLLADVVLPAVASGRSVLTLRDATADAGVGPRIEATAGPPIVLRSAYLSVEVASSGRVVLRRLGTDAPDVVVDPIPVETGRPGSATVAAVRLGASGPVRAEVVVDQKHPGGVVTSTRVVAWAGSETVLLRHRILNREAVPAAPVRSLPVRVHLPGLRSARTMVDGVVRDVALGDDPVRLAQTDASRATSNGEPIGRHLEGAVALGSSALALTAVVPDFWQQYPKALVVSRDALVVDLLSGGAQPVALGVGAAKTHDLWLRLEPAGDATDLAVLARAFQEPPRAVAAPAWTVATGALADVIDPDTPPAHAFLARLRSDALRYESRARYERWDEGPPGPCSARTAANPRTGFFGALNWGDWNFPGYHDESKECDAWGNLEYDLPLVFGLAWVSTGDPLWAPWFERALAHYRDVDVIHASPAHPDWVGLNHPHKVGHFDARARAKVDLGHVWLGGLLLHHRLTGDDRSGEAMLAMAERLAAIVGRTRTPRQFGWPMIALAAAAEATGDGKLRDAALRYARDGMAAFPPDPGASDWKIGILASGLADVHRLTGDADAGRWLERYGAHLLADPRAKDLDPRYLAVAGYLAGITGDARYGRLVSDVASAMSIGTWGKPLALYGRVGFELLATPPKSAR